ncbi:MFS transporter [Maritalea sp.]|uniref:MFS transporter n=1 Tax=Maritalea sp. TaxID=2003361 RepID=UPI003EF11D58
MSNGQKYWNAVSAMFALNGALFGIWASRIPAIVQRFELSHTSIGLLLLLMAAGAIVSFPVAGHLADKLGAFRVTKFTAIFYVLALILLGVSPSIYFLAVALFFFGATHGAMDVAMNSWATEVEKANGKPQMSSFHAMFSMGAGLGAATGFVAVTAGLSPAMHFAIAAVCIGIVAFAFANISWTSTQHQPTSKPPLFAIPRGPLLAVGVIAFCSAIGEGGMADWGAIFLKSVTSASEANAALGYTVFSIGMVIVRFLGGQIIARFGSELSARMGGLFALVGCSAAVISGTFVFGLIGFGLMGMGYALIIPIAFTKAAEFSPKSPGVAIAAVSTLGYGGLLLGPPLIGFVAGATSIRGAFLVLAALALVIVFLSRVLRASPDPQ